MLPHNNYCDGNCAIIKILVPEEDQKSSTLTDDQACMIAKLLIDLEEKNGKPQDFEWGFEDG